VVERGVESELVEQVGDLLVRPGAADDPVPAQLRELRRETSDRAGRGRNPDDVAVAHPCDVEEPGVGGQAHAAQRTQIPLRRRTADVEPGQRAEPAECRRSGCDDCVVTPPGRMRHGVAHREPLGAGLDDLADGHDPVHRRPQAKRGEVAGRPALGEPQPQPGVDRRPRVADQHFSRPGLAHGNLDDAEVAGSQLAVGVRDELDLARAQRLSTVHALTPGAP
jgi:hypothetical protein